LAGKKANVWELRHHPETIQYYQSLPDSLKRHERVNKVYEYIEAQRDMLMDTRPSPPEITLGSDGFFPFTDNIYVAKLYGVKYILQPGGSVMDEAVEETCAQLDIQLTNVNTRMFYH
jgi:phosphoribosylaminoimidazolecarboxamide formyltransferase/IMP cyclohydrolase